MALLEIACFNTESAVIAQENGADRIEFCAGYEVGGITPDYEMLESAKAKISIPVFVMIRPRGGNFFYSDEEFAQMQSDVSRFSEIADGFVFGILTSENNIDIDRNSKLVELTTLPCTFHRAFDETTNFNSSIETLIECGFQNVLTSGGIGNATKNIEALTNLIHQSAGRINVMPGGGIRSSNIKALQHTTANWFHSSAIKSGEIADASEIGKLKSGLD